MNIFKTLKIILLLGLLFVLSILVGSYFTGHEKRAYKTYLPTDKIKVANSTFTIEDLAEEYKPKMYLRPSTPSPNLEWVWYEAVPNDSTIDLNYYFVWENEIHPNRITHILYAIYRAAFYGFPVYDIEYFQINVNKTDGTVERLRFETSKSDDYFQKVVEHIGLAIDKDKDGNYHKTEISKNKNQSGSKELITLEFDENRIKAGVQT